MKPMTLKEMEHQFVYNDGQDIDVEIYDYFTYERVGEKYKVYAFKLPNINDVKDDIEHYLELANPLSLGDIAVQSSSMDSDFDITFSKAQLSGMKKYCVINEENVKISNNLQDCLDLFFKNIIFDQPNLLRRLS